METGSTESTQVPSLLAHLHDALELCKSDPSLDQFNKSQAEKFKQWQDDLQPRESLSLFSHRNLFDEDNPTYISHLVNYQLKNPKSTWRTTVTTQTNREKAHGCRKKERPRFQARHGEEQKRNCLACQRHCFKEVKKRK